MVERGEAITHIFGNSIPKGVFPSLALLGADFVKDTVEFSKQPRLDLPPDAHIPLRSKYVTHKEANVVPLEDTGTRSLTSPYPVVYPVEGLLSCLGRYATSTDQGHPDRVAR